MAGKKSSLLVISLLGGLSVVSPFAIDMYLSAYKELENVFGVPTTTIALTLSSYFIGLGLGQLIYGPLLDRFGRKKPLAFGLGLFIATSIGCTFAPDVYTLIALRFVQALGGCVAQVASVAMVRDFYPRSEAARILSRLFLFIAVSPLLAPTVGALVIEVGGWKAAFFALGGVVALILAGVYFLLPEGHKPDPDISLSPVLILAEYKAILRHPRFSTYAGAGAFSFAGLFTYVAGSPIIFMDGFGLGKREYSFVFALLAAGFIGGSQLNVLLLRRAKSERLFLWFLIAQVVAGAVFFIGTAAGGLDLVGTLVVLFVFLSCIGVTNPNASALAIAPFSKNAGSASALLGFFQLGVGALISTGIGAATSKDSLPIVAIMAVTAVAGLTILLVRRKRAEATPVNEHPTPAVESKQQEVDATNRVEEEATASPCCQSTSDR